MTSIIGVWIAIIAKTMQRLRATSRGKLSATKISMLTEPGVWTRPTARCGCRRVWHLIGLLITRAIGRLSRRGDGHGLTTRRGASRRSIMDAGLMSAVDGRGFLVPSR